MKIKETIAERIKRLRERKNWSQRELAEACGWSTQSRVGNYESGARKISIDDASIIAKALGVEPTELLFGEKQNVGQEELTYAGKARKGIVKVIGEAILGANGAVDMVELRDGWLKIYSDDPNAFGLKVRGDSMWPRIQSGEYVLIEPSRNISPGDEVFVRTVEGHNMIKKLGYHRDGKYEFISVNQNHAPITMQESEVAKIEYVAGILKESQHIDDEEAKGW